MRFWVYDDEGKLFRRFAFRIETERFLQPGWLLVVQPKQRKPKPLIEQYGEALF